MSIPIEAVQTAIEGAKDIYHDLLRLLTEPGELWSRIEHIDYRVGAPFIIVTGLAVAFATMTILANIIKPPTEGKPSAFSGVVRKPGSPPIPPPTEVVALRIYPIKSCRGFELSETRLRKTGLTLDRNWMFISKADNKFLTIRSDPSMTLIDTALADDPKTKEQMLRISIHGHDTLVTIPAFPTREWLRKNTKLSTVEIWEEETDAYEYSDEINATFSKFFSKPVALVYKGPTARMVGVNGSKEMYGSETPHHFADVMSLLVASEASIRDLNRRMTEKAANGGPSLEGMTDLTIERFRPNIIVRGRDDHPWEEDTWKRVRLTTSIPSESALYKMDLDVVARCARCQVPNVNPDTAEKHPKEPWEELMKFRRVDKGSVAKYKPCFGMLCVPRNEGRVQIGTTLEVLETTDKHSFNTAKFSEL